MVIIGDSTLSGKAKSYETDSRIGHVFGKVGSKRAFTVDALIPPIMIDYTDLTKLSEKIRRLLDIYRSKQTNKLIQEYDYDELSFDINEGQQFTVLGTTLRDLFNSATESLDQGLIQIRDNDTLREENEDLQELRKIINNTDKLKEYIESKNRTHQLSTVFSIPNIKVDKSPMLKEEYKEYILLHGFPEYGVFDSDKIFEIRKRLGIDPTKYKKQWI